MEKPNSAIVAAVSAVLARWHVYTASDSNRAALAEIVASAGRPFGDHEMQVLVCEARDVRGARRPIGLVVSWLQSGAWVELVAEVAKQPDNTPHSASSRAGWQPPTEWSQEVELHRLLSVALGDRKPADVVASRFGYSVAEVRQLVDTHGRRVFGDRSVDLWLGKLPRPSFPRKTKETHGG